MHNPPFYPDLLPHPPTDPYLFHLLAEDLNQTMINDSIAQNQTMINDFGEKMHNPPLYPDLLPHPPATPYPSHLLAETKENYHLIDFFDEPIIHKMAPIPQDEPQARDLTPTEYALIGTILTSIGYLISSLFGSFFTSEEPAKDEIVIKKEVPETSIDKFFKQIASQNNKHISKLTNPEIEVTVNAKSSVGPSFEYTSTFTHKIFNVDTDDQIGAAHGYQYMGNELVNEWNFGEYDV